MGRKSLSIEVYRRRIQGRGLVGSNAQLPGFGPGQIESL